LLARTLGWKFLTQFACKNSWLEILHAAVCKKFWLENSLCSFLQGISWSEILDAAAARNLLLEIVDACSLQEILVGNSWCRLPEMEERKTKSAALVFHRFAGAEFKEVTGFFAGEQYHLVSTHPGALIVIAQ
jgi:hypothetical protein